MRVSTVRVKPSFVVFCLILSVVLLGLAWTGLDVLRVVSRDAVVRAP